MDNISLKIDELSEAFFDLDLVKDYFKQVDLINADEALLSLSDEVKKLPKDDDTQYQEMKNFMLIIKSSMNKN